MSALRISTSFQDRPVAANGALFFSFNNQDGNGRELWISDGTFSGTRILADLRPGAENSNPINLVAVDDQLYFTAFDGAAVSLWKSDGTEAGTVGVRDVEDAEDLTSVAGTLFFVAEDAIHGRELWYSDGTTLGTSLVDNIAAGSGSSNPQGITESGGKVFVAANDGAHGIELWGGELSELIDPPSVAAVRLSSSAWDDQFRAFIDPELSLGYPIPPTSQLDPLPGQPLPWININKIDVVFDQDVDVELASFTLTGVNVPLYSFLPDDPLDTVAADLDGFRYDSTTFTATLVLDNPIATDRLLLDIGGESADTAPVQASGGGPLLEGGGGSGTDFEIFFDILPGDATRNGSFSVTDVANVAARVQPGKFNTLYDPFFDLDGSGSISVTDVVNGAARLGPNSTLPPGSPSNPAVVALIRPIMAAAGVILIEEEDDETSLHYGTRAIVNDFGVDSFTIQTEDARISKTFRKPAR